MIHSGNSKLPNNWRKSTRDWVSAERISSDNLEHLYYSKSITTVGAQNMFVASAIQDVASSDQSEMKVERDLYGSMRLFLIFGRFIGLVPIQGLFNSDSKALTYSKGNFWSVITLTYSVAMGITAIVSLVGVATADITNAGDYARNLSVFIFYATSAFLLAYFFLYSDHLITIFRVWTRMRTYFFLKDETLYRDVNIIMAVITASAVLENALGNLNQFPVIANSQGSSTCVASTAFDTNRAYAGVWETYYIRSHCQWAKVVPFNMPSALFLFLTNKVGVYSWNYMDLLIMIMARALYHKFKSLWFRAESVIIKESNTFDPNLWRELTKDHQILCHMLKVVNEFLGPLIFMSYAKNIYFVCVQMHMGLTPSETRGPVAFVYAMWSFLQLIVRILLVNELGAKIHVWAHKITELCRKCPAEAYIPEVERTERFVGSHTICLTGSGCFNVTKPLILSVVGIVFTFEVVLLQASQAPLVSVQSLCGNITS